VNAKLFVFRNDGTSREISLKPGQYLVGRGKQAALRIPLPSISREHCLITLDAAALTIKDLGSSNGTFRNHHRITEATLEPGDSIGIGDITLVVQIDGRPAQVAPPAPATPGSSGSSAGPGGSSMLMETPPNPPASPKPAKAPTPTTTPTTTPPAPPTPAAAPKPAPTPTHQPPKKPTPPPAKPPADPDADTAGDLGTLPQALSSGESSIFDFDFDLEDDDRPKL